MQVNVLHNSYSATSTLKTTMTTKSPVFFVPGSFVPDAVPKNDSFVKIPVVVIKSDASDVVFKAEVNHDLDQEHKM